MYLEHGRLRIEIDERTGPDLAALAMLLARLAAIVVLGVLPGQRTANAYGLASGRTNLAETFS